MMFNMFTEPKLIEPEKALPGREAPPPGHNMVLRMAASWVPQAPMRVSDRHAVLGSKMKGPWPAGYKVAVFANGCFWGSEKGIWRLPGDGIYTTAVGYAAGFTPNPTYEEACSGRTGHTEAVQVVFDPEKPSQRGTAALS
ncbi:methionine sulfoxide reductase [Emiliania huxleyi CCMP1516]|uniref:peptide-methionine (S)-S-oxide reductase n=2 Tax=Emiliania huxleyi TaxID=2903 RepID=A0A0D3KVX2_EMIH1|nr:methionine sulfoxide reductase [Emiliania huxleyi CCMP1516]EOD39907.1 methionine sulfoxide reductase [Emiliania huxleyi CCMP1516]|eukprot:XP_005792336.1 methionine sulfoxide reductase [Emiliania huxleyi CCMP1516]